MTEPAVRAIETLIEHARDLFHEGRHRPAAEAAARAAQAADQIENPALLVRALETEANVLRMQGEHGAALTRYTRVLAVAEDTGTRIRLEQPAALMAVAGAFLGWVTCARSVRGIQTRQLLDVLEAGERYLHPIGRTPWRAALLLQRASIHDELGDFDTAVALGEEALAAHEPGPGGYSLAGHRRVLGQLLRRAGRPEEAEPLYQAALEDHGALPDDRVAALEGLARCALDRGDAIAAQRHAAAALEEAEPFGDEYVRTPLSALVQAHQDAGDLDAAAPAAARYLDVARRLGSYAVLFSAIRSVVTVALDRGQIDNVAQLLSEMAEHAAVLDRNSDDSFHAEQVVRYSQRFDSLRAAGQIQALGVPALTHLSPDLPDRPGPATATRPPGRTMTVVGIRVEQPSDEPIVLLKETDGNTYLPIRIGATEAAAISHAQQGTTDAVSRTHDLLCDVLTAAGLRLEMATIDHIEENAFIASITVNGKQIDSRPSDAIVLTLKTGAPLIVAQDVLDTCGLSIPDEEP